MEQNLYYYKATVKEVKDADTIVLDIDCGFDIWLKNISCRLSRIKTTIDKEKYGRVLCEVFLKE